MLTEQDKKAIDACVTRPNSVWDAIKSIITAEKYTWYLEAMAAKYMKPEIATIKRKWDELDDDKARAEYMNTNKYDKDLRDVLQQVSCVLGGFDPKDDDFKVGTKIPIWEKGKTMKRKTAFNAAIAFRFTIEETRKLLFTVLADNEQYDFDPRLPNEMIYAYVIINATSKHNNDKKPRELVQEMLNTAQKAYLMNLFGEDYSKYYDDLILVAEDSFNIFDSLNMTRSAFSLSIVKYVSENKITVENAGLILNVLMNDNAFSPEGIVELLAIMNEKNKFSKKDIRKVLVSLIIEGGIKYQHTANTIAEILNQKELLPKNDVDLIFAPLKKTDEEKDKKKGKKPVIFTSESANAYLSLLAEKNILSDEDVNDLSNLFSKSNSKKNKKTLMPDNSITQLLYENTYGNNIFDQTHTPDYNTAMRNRENYLKMFELADRYLNAAIKKVKKKDSMTYERILDFVSQAWEYVKNSTHKNMLSPLDFLPLLERSGLGNIDGVTKGIKNVLISKYIEEAKPRTQKESKKKDKIENEDSWDIEGKQKRSSDYHPTNINQIISNDQGKYFVFFWKMIKDGIKQLQVYTERNMLFFWDVYTEMNNILLYPYYNENGICMRIINYYNEKRKKEGKIEDEILYTYTVEIIETYIENAEYGVSPSELISGLLNDIHCYVYFNHSFISRGKEKFVKELDEKGVIDSLMMTGDEQPDYLRAFYSADIFFKQDFEHSIPYRRKDILKLAFWDWVNDDDHLKQGTASRKRGFMTHFDDLVDKKGLLISKTNTNNSLDNFLLMCLEADSPISFLQDAIEYSDKLKKIF